MRIVLALGLIAACGGGGGGGPDGGDGPTGPTADAPIAPHDDWTVFPIGDVRDLDVDGTVVWAATAAGVVRVDGDVVTTFGLADGVPSVDCTAIAVDPARDQVWVGTKDAGVAVYAAGAWTAGPVLPWQNIGAVGVAPSGDVWIGAGPLDPQGLLRYDGVGLEPHSTDGDDVRAIYVKASGEVWVATLRGVMVRDGAGTWTPYNSFTLGFSLGFADALFEATDGAMWIATLGDGVVRTDGGTGWTVWNRGFDPDMPNTYLAGVVIDTAGFAWLASQGSGLVKLDFDPPSPATVAGQGDWTMFRTDNSPFPDIDNTSNDIVRDSTDALWIGMPTGGLARLR